CKHGYLDEQPLEARSNEPAAQTALDACAAIAMGRGNVTTMPRDGTEADDDGHRADEERPDTPALVVERDGFNLHGVPAQVRHHGAVLATAGRELRTLGISRDP